MPVDLYRFALSAFWCPLLDDSEPRRWTDVAITYSCDPGTSVMIDGEPMVVGKLIPAKAFTVRWTMHNCAPMGRAWLHGPFDAETLLVDGIGQR